MLSLRKLLTGPPSRLKNIVRFSYAHRIRNESVAEHSFYTAFYAMLIAEDLKGKCKALNIERLLSRALVHDVEETFSGDFVRTFKTSSPGLRDAMDKAGTVFAKKFFEYLGFPAMTRDWVDAKDNTLEGRVLRFADFLSVLFYVYTEAHMGNQLIVQSGDVDGLAEYLDTFEVDEYNFLQCYIAQAEGILSDIKRRSNTWESPSMAKQSSSKD